MKAELKVMKTCKSMLYNYENVLVHALEMASRIKLGATNNLLMHDK